MKKLSFLILFAAIVNTQTPAMAAGTTKEVCSTKTKNGVVQKQCKKIKVHKKVEGKKVPK